MYLYIGGLFDVKEKRLKLKGYKNETCLSGNVVIKSVRCVYICVTKAQYFSLGDMIKY
jgi:hypothetical protein